MQVILNSLIFFLIYFSLQIFLYRLFKINLNKISIVLFIIGISIVIAFYSPSIEMLMNLININLMIICFYITMTGIVNQSPSLAIVDLIVNKGINKKEKLKKFLLKGKTAKEIEKRLKINVSSNFLEFHEGKFFIKKNIKIIIIFFNFIKKIYRLKSDV